MEAPVIIKPIPAQVINERAAFAPFDLKQFVKAPDDGALRFSAALDDGSSLPKGMICTADGVLTGIPGADTQGNYQVIVTVENDAGHVVANFVLTIKPSLAASNTEYIDKLKSQIWDALEKNLPIPELEKLYELPITAYEIYYMIERWGTLTVWDAFNLDPAGEKILLHLDGVSEHYQVYDRGSCLVACPKDLFSYQRTLEDALQTARAVAREVYHRKWTIELSGFDKMTRAAWVEIQHLGDKHGKALEIINFNPTPDDVKVYQAQAESIKIRTGMEK